MSSGGQSDVEGGGLSELGARVTKRQYAKRGACSPAGKGEADELEYHWPLDTRLYGSFGLLPIFHAIAAVIGPRNGF